MNCEKCVHGIFCPTWGMWKCVEKIRWVFQHEHESSAECAQYVAKKSNDIAKECQCEECLTLKGSDE